jgi:hypothetical protein
MPNGREQGSWSQLHAAALLTTLGANTVPREARMSTTTVTADPTKSSAERALAAVPIVLTVMATILAGMSSSEMTQSMYYRSLAAQNQARAGSQWGLFQAKRIRGTMMEGSGELIRALADPPALDVVKLRTAAERIEAAVRRAGGPQPAVDAANGLRQVVGWDSVRQAIPYVTGTELPAVNDQPIEDDHLRAVCEAVGHRQTEAQTEAEVANIPHSRIAHALDTAEANAAAFDEACKPVTTALNAVDRQLTNLATELRKLRAEPPSGTEQMAALEEASRTLKDTTTGLRAAKQDFTARRYARESTYNQQSAELLEMMARRNGYSADRHRSRSRNFFYAMLCAQAGVTVASFALARSRKSWFWGVAGMAGVIAVSFGAYVYVAL